MWPTALPPSRPSRASAPGRRPPAAGAGADRAPALDPAARAIGFLRWFSSQARVMDLATRERLWDAWGMCAEHSLAWLAVEHDMEAGWVHGPTIVYEDLLEQARWALRPRWLVHYPPVADLLQPISACLVCEAAGDPGSASRSDGLAGARDDVLRHLVGADGSQVERWICGSCAGTAAATRCRPHLVADLQHDRRLDLAPHRALIGELLDHLARYSRSFGWMSRGTDTADDRAALVAAVGWCGGWRSLLDWLG